MGQYPLRFVHGLRCSREFFSCLTHTKDNQLSTSRISADEVEVAKKLLIHFRSHRYPFTVSIKTILNIHRCSYELFQSNQHHHCHGAFIDSELCDSQHMHANKKRRMLENSSSYNLCCGEFSVRSEEAWRESNLGKLYFTA